MKKSEIFEKNKDSIVQLDVVIPEGENRQKMSIRGSGFIVSKDGYLITNAHVYSKLSEKEKKYFGAKVPEETDTKGIAHYKRYKVELVDLDKKNDIALMKLDIKGNKKKMFQHIDKIGDPDNVNAGDDVVFLGYPLALELLKMGFGITLSADSCIISSVKRRGADGSLHFFMIDTHINNGSSGSPVFLVETGEIVGIASGKVSTQIPRPEKGVKVDVPANIGICRPANYITNLLSKNKIKISRKKN